MKKMKKGLSIMLVAVMVLAIFPLSANASSISGAKTVDEGETYTDSNFQMFCWGGAATFTNNGTVTITGGFTLGWKATFVNNGTFNFTGSSSTFDVSSGDCAFINNGTATVSGCYNFGISGTFTNTGTLYLSDIDNINTDGLVNEGTIICGDNVSEYAVQKLVAKTTSNGKVLMEGEYDSSEKTKYSISYDLSGGSWIGGEPNEELLSYYYEDGIQFYKIGITKPFDMLNDSVTRANYDLLGWTCEKAADSEPSLYLDILTEWRSDIELKAHWKPTTYRIAYRLDGGTFEESTALPEILYDGDGPYSQFNVESDDFTLPTPVKSGYDFAGWILGGTADSVPTVTIPKGTAGNRLYTAKWIPKGDTQYTVNVYYMDETGQYKETADVSRLEKGETDTSATVPASSYAKEGFSFDEIKSISTGTIAADGTLVLSLYYTRNQYDIAFKSYDGSETLYSYKGYYGTPIQFNGSEPTITDEDYIYTFVGWAPQANSPLTIEELGSISEDKTFYAVFEKEATFCLITFDDIEGFVPLQETTIKINKGEDFSIDLYLANEKYYIGTNEWTLTFDELHIADEMGIGLELDTDFSYSFEGYGKPVVLSIPNVTKDRLTIKFTARYHENHDFDKNYDVVEKNATCNTEGDVLHFCYMCGKTEAGKIGIDPQNHTNLAKVDAKSETHLQSGNIEYYYCDGCEKYFSDSEATEEITVADIVIPADGHKLVKTEAKAATCIEEGYTGDKVCTVCKEVIEQGEVIQKLAHDYKNGKCTVCEAVDPDYVPETDSPQTGDNSNMALWIALLFISGSAVITLTVVDRKRRTAKH